MKLYEKPELTKVEILASERLMTSGCEPEGSEGPGLPGIACEVDTVDS